MPDPVKDHLDRLRQMANPRSKWDLSSNDRDAIRAALDRIAHLEAGGDFAPTTDPNSNTSVANFSGSQMEYEPIANDSVIRFYVGPKRLPVDVRVRGDALHVYASDTQLNIMPEASNVVRVQPRERL